MNKNCIYFVLTGNYDVIREPTYITPGWDYICFTNNANAKSKFWDIRFLENKDNLDNKRLSRLPWILFHKYVSNYDLSISIGGNTTTKGNLNDFVEKYLPKDIDIDMSIAKHPRRKNIFEEADQCIHLKKDDPDIIRKQMESYKKEGYIDTGLVAGGLMIRKHNRKNLEEHCEKWFEQILKHSWRKQLSFNYILWKYNLIKINMIPYDLLVGKDNYFSTSRHIRNDY